MSRAATAFALAAVGATAPVPGLTLELLKVMR
jgi:hypothetical protein